ncbi:MAG: dihydroorotase [Dehalococcoidales bacterium]|nr:dihydroorotase [Dehalococcoidales bacterium]
MQEILIRNGRIIDPSQDVDGTGDVLIRDGRISAIWTSGSGSSLNGAVGNELIVIDASGCVVCPGFVDLHAHLREPGYEDKETIATGARAAAAGGFTTVCCMPNTNPAIDNLATLNYVRQVAASESIIRVLPVAAITKKRAGVELCEMGELARGGAVGFSDDGRPVPESLVMRYALEYARMLDRPIISHCEDLDLAKGGVMNEGLVATKLGLRGIPAAAEDIIVARDIALAELAGGRLHITHVSTAGAVELIRRAKEKGLRVSADATPHHLVLTDEWVAGQRRATGMSSSWAPMPPYNTNTKVNPPLRTRVDTEALVQGLRDGTIDAIATDHAPHTVVDKQCEYDQAEFGISGLETALGLLMTLVQDGHIDLDLLISKLTAGPARVLGLPFGTLEEGDVADVTIFDPQMEWRVDPDTFASKGKNTPLAGLVLRGRVVYAIAGGSIAFSDRKLSRVARGVEARGVVEA